MATPTVAASANFSWRSWAHKDTLALNSPRIGVPFFEPSGLPDAVYEAGAEPVPLRLPAARPGGVALARAWISDLATISSTAEHLDAILIPPGNPEETFGLLIAALRLNLPTACAPPSNVPMFASLASLGLTPLNGQPFDVVAALGRDKGPAVGDLIENFSLANAVRAAVAAGGGVETLVHLSAVAREAGVVGFSRMIQVLAPETPAVPPKWLHQHGPAGLLAHLDDELHDIATVEGKLKEGLKASPPEPEEHSRIMFVRGRSSGAEAMCRVASGVTEIAGQCRVFDSEEAIVRAVAAGELDRSALVVVRGCGPRGAPGLSRLDGLTVAMRESGLDLPVLTDGVAPENAPGTWISLFAPEAAVGGVIGRLRDGDALRLDFAESRIRTAIEAKELAKRPPFEGRNITGYGYEARYARSTLPALEGAGFG
ncbi:MAG: dihydroxy-acid dehydratase [Actinomycetota bacterium]|nr:dihydroxy-acid dehydratase [Actinomycetota bacterium]